MFLSNKERMNIGWQDFCLNAIFVAMILTSAGGLIYVFTH